MMANAQDLTLADFDFELPEDLIAQTPAAERDRSRLLVLDRNSGAVSHRSFSDIVDILREGDLLVLNDTRVMPCRIIGKKSGGGRSEIFLLEETGVNLWRAMVSNGVGIGKRVSIPGGVDAEVIADEGDGVRMVRFHGTTDVKEILPQVGLTPLPPYIRREPNGDDLVRYQTVYSRREGAVAAPTAGLHFTEGLLNRLREKGIGTAMVTLHVGPGTFKPVRANRVAEHRMHAERYEISEQSAMLVNRSRAEGRRIIAVGTTTVRTLETAADDEGQVSAGKGSSKLFILPGYRFKTVDGMITNFHLPKSTLLMLVAAFAGREQVLAAYRAAVQARYRFYSYGDAMIIL